MLNKKITFDRFIRWALIALLVVTVLYIVSYLSNVLLPFFVAWLLAYLLYPIVRFVQYKLHVRVRALAIVLSMVAVLGLIGGVLYFIIPPMIEQFDRLTDVAGRYLKDTTHSNSVTAWMQQWLQDNRHEVTRFFHSKDFSDIVKTTMPRLFAVLGQTASIVMSIVASFITLLYMFFILLDYETLTNNWIKIFPQKNRPFWKELMHDVERELNNYIRGQSLVSLIMGILFCIGFTLIDFPMGIGLGILIGLLNLVPYLHTLALVPTAILALLKAADTGENFWWVFVPALLVFLIVQLISDLVVTPRIMGKAMRLNPAILLLSLSVWGALLGFVGLIIALPLTTLIIAYWQRYVTKEYTAEQSQNSIH